MTAHNLIEWALGRRFQMVTSVDGDKPGYRFRKVLDFTIVSIDAAADTCRVHVNDAQKSRQLLGWSTFCDGLHCGIIVEVDGPAIVHDGPARASLSIVRSSDGKNIA